MADVANPQDTGVPAGVVPAGAHPTPNDATSQPPPREPDYSTATTLSEPDLPVDP